MKRLSFIIAFCVCSGWAAQAATYTLCTSGNWTETGGSARFSTDNGATCNILPNSIAFAAGDFLVIPESLSLTLAKNLEVTVDITVQIDGNLNFDNGKLKLTENSVIKLGPNGTLTCDGGNCGNNEQISVGQNQYSGEEIEAINDGPRPVSISGGGLPVIISHFEVEDLDGKVQISWTTTAEENFDKFIIQRSGNGKDFQNLSEIKGQGRNLFDIESKYSFIDAAPLVGFNYYRLKAIDLDNTSEHFGVKVVKINSERAITIFPNPSTGNNISFYANFSPGENDSILLRNNLGHVIYFSLIQDQTTIELSQPALSPGIYFLEYHGTDYKQVARVFVK